MSRLFAFNMVTLDGYFEGLNHDISWHNVDREFGEFAVAQLNEIGTLLFGRTTYEMMAGYWPSPAALGDDPTIAGLMNGLPKVAVSRTLQRVEWNNSRLIKDRVPQAISDLKRQSAKDVAVFGSANLLRTLMDADLVDEHRLIVNPVLLGHGTSLFQVSGAPLHMKLIRSRAFSNGNVLVCYEPVRKSP